MSRPPLVATIRDNIACWRGLDGKKYYRPLLSAMKFSRLVFFKKTEAMEYRKRVLERYEKLKRASKLKPVRESRRWLS